MEIQITTIIVTFINIAIIVTILMGIKIFIDFIKRSKQMDEKLDKILNQLEKEENN